MTPKEVWVLRWKNTGHLLPPMDDDGTDGFMAWPSREQAEVGKQHQIGMYDIDADELAAERLALTS